VSTSEPRGPLDFTGQAVLVTGGSSGIGNGIARAFRDAGARVVATGTRAAAADYDSDLAGIDYRRLDVADDDAVAAFDLGTDRLDVLVSSVGTVAYRRQEFTIPVFRHVLDVNLTGVMHTCVRCHDRLKAARGRVVVVASMASFHATRGNPAYSASKGGLLTLVKTLADAWGRDGIRVNGIAPGFVESKLTRVTRDDPALYEATLRRTPLGRWGTLEDMGQVALFLASPMSAFMTGAMLPVDGGMHLG
jgi:3-oxoacyl-[acyl-carrier protein] reductase